MISVTLSNLTIEELRKIIEVIPNKISPVVDLDKNIILHEIEELKDSIRELMISLQEEEQEKLLAMETEEFTPPPAHTVFKDDEAPEVEKPAPAFVNKTLSGSVELDARGLPWDSRIHSRNKTKTGNGSWKLKREVKPEMVSLVEDELRGRYSAPLKETLASAATVEGPSSIEAYANLVAKATDAIRENKITKEKVLEIVQTVSGGTLLELKEKPEFILTVSNLIENEIA